jgi:rod shape-determining protein MreC
VVTVVDGDRTVAKPIADPAGLDFAIVLPVYQPAATRPLSEASSKSLEGAQQ